MFTEHNVAQLILTIVYSAVGMIAFGLGFVIFSKLTPFDFWKEIEEDQNTALGIMVASVILGLAIIIAAAIT